MLTRFASNSERGKVARAGDVVVQSCPRLAGESARTISSTIGGISL
jgi:hypothetical protein